MKTYSLLQIVRKIVNGIVNGTSSINANKREILLRDIAYRIAAMLNDNDINEN